MYLSLLVIIVLILIVVAYFRAYTIIEDRIFITSQLSI